MGDEDGGDAGLREPGESRGEPDAAPARGPGADPMDTGAESGAKPTETGADPRDTGAESGALLDLLARARANVARERDDAPALARELAALPPDRQLAEVAGDARFQTFGFSELLLADAAAPGIDPAEAGRLAALALAAASRLDGALHPPPIVRDLEARAWGAAGEARRAAGDLPGAEEALAAAASCLAHGTGDLTVDAQLLEFEAAVRAGQGRLSEADALLRQAAARYVRVNDRERAAELEARRAALRRAGAPESPGHPAFEEGG